MLSSLLFAAALAAASDQPEWRQTHREVELADGVVAFIAAESPGGIVQGNITLLSGSRHSLLVDSGQYPVLAQQIVDALQARGVPPVRYIINTHWHGDHLLANHVFTAAWPDAVVIRHRETDRLGERNYADWEETAPRRMREAAERIQASLDSGTAADGKPLDDDARRRARTTLGLIGQWLAQGSGRWQAADLLIDADIELELGDRRVAVRHPGRANTSGDLVVWDARTGTLVTGDIVVHPTPYSFGSFHGDWIATLDALRGYQPRQIVPGHGAPMQDDAYLQQLQALLSDTRREVAAAVADGLDLQAVRERVRLPAHERAFAGDDPIRIDAFRRFFLAPGVERAYKEVRGEPLLE